MGTDALVIFIRRELSAIESLLLPGGGATFSEKMQLKGYRWAYSNILQLIVGERPAKVFNLFNRFNREEGEIK
jgi:hypothetical protein